MKRLAILLLLCIGCQRPSLRPELRAEHDPATGKAYLSPPVGLQKSINAAWLASPETLDGMTRTCVIVLGDFDGDGDVDPADFAVFAGCFNGPNRPPKPGADCSFADIDSDGDVDLTDFGVFASCFNGANRAAPWHCYIAVTPGPVARNAWITTPEDTPVTIELNAKP